MLGAGVDVLPLLLVNPSPESSKPVEKSRAKNALPPLVVPTSISNVVIES